MKTNLMTVPKSGTLIAVVVCLLAAAVPAAAHVNVFGPKVYTASSSAPQTVSETITLAGPCDLTPNAVYTLVVANDGVSSASIQVNGAEAVSESDFSQQAASIERTVMLAASNTLTVTIKGGRSDGKLTLTIRRHIDLTESVFAEKTYTTTGKSDTFRDSFNVAATTGSFSIIVRNGTPAVESGSVHLNGAEVVSEQELKASAVVRKNVTLAASNQLVFDTKSNGAGAKSSVAIVRHLIDTAGPAIAPGVVDGQVVAVNPFRVTGTVSDPSGVAAFGVNGTAVPVGAAGAFSTDVALVPGSNVIRFDATDCEGNATHREVTVAYNAAPALTITTPAPNSFHKGAVAMSGTVTSLAGVQSVVANGAAMTVGGGSWSGTVTLSGSDGAREIVVVATDVNGKQDTKSVTVILDGTGPMATIEDPTEGMNVFNSPRTILGIVTDAGSGAVSVVCNGNAGVIDGSAFRCAAAVAAGASQFTVVFTDAVGNATTIQRHVQFVTDTDLPTATVRVLPSPNAAGWTRGPVRVFFTCADATGGVVECPSDQQIDEEGEGIVAGGPVRDQTGNTIQATVTLNIDSTAPALSFGNIPDVLNTGAYLLAGIASDALSGIDAVTCDGVPAARAGDMITCNLTLIPGTNAIEIEARDRAGNETLKVVQLRSDMVAPTLAFENGDTAATTAAATYQVTGYANDESGVTVTLNGQPIALAEGTFSRTATLQEGTNVFTAVATDGVGNSSTATLTVARVTPIEVAITSPADLATVSTSTTTVTGDVSPAGATVTVNDIPAIVSGGRFTAAGVPLAQGRTIITAVAAFSGRVAAANLNVYRDSIPPRIEVYTPAANSTVSEQDIAVSGMVDDIVVGTINGAQVAVTVNGTPAAVANRAFLAQNVRLDPGPNTLTIAATDQGGNTKTVTRTVTYTPISGASRIERVSGSNQTAPIGAALPQPLVVRLVNASGSPVANTPVVFEITQNNGTVSAGTESGRIVTATTSAQGLASVTWTLGMRAGAGNNRVEATAEGFAGVVEFLAVAGNGAASLIVVDSGNNQFGTVDDPLQRPLIAVAVDAGSNRVANVPVTFRVAAGGGSIDGAQSKTVPTDSDGRAWVLPQLGPEDGNDNNIFEAAIADASPIRFVASGRKPGPVSATKITGVVLDNSNIPVAGVLVRIDESTQSVQTDGQGQFVIQPAPVGYVKLIVDGSTAQRPGTWPTLEFVLYTLPGTDNNVGMPIYLLPIEVPRGIQVTETTGGTLTLPELPGFSLTIKPGSALFPSGSRAGTVSATLVHADKVPMTPGFGQQPRFIVTIQPTGVHFDPPAAITFPNLDGLAPGEITEMYSFDHDLGQFVAIGTAMISEDGSTLQSDPGVGIIKGGWHCGGNPNPTGSASCVNVSAVAPKIGKVDVPLSITATGTPAQGGSYVSWDVVDDPQDPNDDPTAAAFITAPACPSSATCVAQLRATRGGRVSVQVSYTAPSGTASTAVRGSVSTNATTVVKSKIIKIFFPAFEMSAVNFTGSGEIFKDRLGGVDLTNPTEWIAGTPAFPALEEPVTYPRSLPGAPRKIELSVQIDIAPVLAVPLTGVRLEGRADGITFRSEPFTIPAGVSYLPSWLTVKAEDGLPETTKYYPEFKIDWSYTLPGDSTAVPAGSSKNPLYVTLKEPLPGTKIYLSSLQYAVKKDGASDEVTAAGNTWSHFFGPANVTAHTGRPLFYYRLGLQDLTGMFCANTAELLLTSAQESGQCGSFAELLINSLAINGIPSRKVLYESQNSPGEHLMVHSWTVESSEWPGGVPSVNSPGPQWEPFQYRLEFRPEALVIDNRMFPPMPDDIYHDLRSLPGLRGQNMETPNEKIFVNHIIVEPQFPAGTPIVFAKLYDPSYGVVYVDEDDFEDRAVWGYIRSVPVRQPDGTVQPVFAARRSVDANNAPIHIIRGSYP